MFRSLFNKPQSKSSQRLSPQSWSGADACNCKSFAEKARARARYELAREFHVIGIDWYASNVVADKEGINTPELQERFEEYLADYKRQLADYDCLIRTRDQVLEILRNSPHGIPRKQLSIEVNNQCLFSTVTICNQMERGGLIKQEKVVGKTTVFLSNSPIATDQEFMDLELPKPGTSGMWSH